MLIRFNLLTLDLKVVKPQYLDRQTPSYAQSGLCAETDTFQLFGEKMSITLKRSCHFSLNSYRLKYEFDKHKPINIVLDYQSDPIVIKNKTQRLNGLCLINVYLK